MNYNLELNDLPFEAIKSGKKKIETRTKTEHNDFMDYDQMKPGDILTFTKSSTGEKLTTEILGVRHYSDVASMFDAEGQENCMSYDAPRDEAIKSYDKLTGYTEGIKKYGIWAIEIKV